MLWYALGAKVADDQIEDVDFDLGVEPNQASDITAEHIRDTIRKMEP